MNTANRCPELFHGVKEVEGDRTDICLMHLPQVRLVAKSIWSRLRFAVDLDDLVSYGVIGLLHAMNRYDPSRGILLKTYAEHRIRGAILDGLRGMDWLPRGARQKEPSRRQFAECDPDSEVRGLCGARRSGIHKNGRNGPAARKPPQMESVSPRGSLSDLEKLFEHRQGKSSARSGNENPEWMYQCKESNAQLAKALGDLPRRYRLVLELYYRRELSMKEIADVLRVHESRVSQLHASALQRLRRSPDLFGMGAEI